MNTISLQQLNSMSCEAEVSVRNDSALRFCITSKPPPVFEYVKAISALIGASHILAVFEETDAIKVFFDERRFADTLIKTGIHVLGHHITADYVIPPGIKVVLSNIDPVISNFDVLRLLAAYGDIVSPVVRPSICDDIEFCHIGYGVRYVYMDVKGILPSRLEIRYGDQSSFIKIKIEGASFIPAVKLDFPDSNDEEETNMNVAQYEPVPGPSRLDAEPAGNSGLPVLVSVRSAASDEQIRLQNPPPETKSPVKQLLKKTVRRKTRYAKSLHMKHKRITSATQAANKITRNVKHKWGSKRVGPFKKGRRGRKSVELPPILKPLTPSSSEGDVESASPPLLNNVPVSKGSMEPILDDTSLSMFLEEVKHQRAPLELARKYLGKDCDCSKVNQLVDQLYNFNAMTNKTSLKLRIGRLIKCLKEAAYNDF